MGGFGEELARGLLSHDIFGVGRVGEEIGWVGLAIAELVVKSGVSVGLAAVRCSSRLASDVPGGATCFTSRGVLISGAC